MRRWFLIPLITEIDPYDGEPDTHPKYVTEYNWMAQPNQGWSSHFARDEGFAVVLINTQDTAFLDEIASKSDVTELNGSANAKNDVAGKFGVSESEVNGHRNEIDFIIKRTVPNGRKEDINVG